MIRHRLTYLRRRANLPNLSRHSFVCVQLPETSEVYEYTCSLNLKYQYAQ